MRRRRPGYDLAEIHRGVRAGRFRITLSARDGAAQVGLQEGDILRCVLGLRHTDFYKSMPSEQQPGRWQDVYRPTFEGTRLYVKLQLNTRGDTVVISFKER